MFYDPVRILVIEPSTQSRVRLREILKSIVFKGEIKHVANHDEGFDLLRDRQGWDFVFLGSITKKKLVKDFLRKIYQHPTKRAFLIAALDQTNKDGGTVAKLYLDGVHGFLMQPYSPDKILELLKATKAASEKKGSDPLKGARTTEFLMKNAKSFLNQAAIERAKGNDAGGYAMKELRGVARSIHKMFNQIERLEFEDILLNQFDGKRPPKSPVPGGKSRVKRKAKHPALEIRSLMKERELEDDKITEILTVDREDFDDFMREQGSMTRALASDLARIFGRSPHYWINQHKKFDENQSGNGDKIS